VPAVLWSENIEGRYQLRGFGINGRVVLKLFFKKRDVIMWLEFISLRIVGIRRLS
jgi:hypothetical protein